MAFVGDDLIAILVRSDGPNPHAGRWSIDWMAPAIDGRPPLFTQLEAARLWLSHRYCSCLARPNKARRANPLGFLKRQTVSAPCSARTPPLKS